jgi:hypothetical protein
VRRPWIIDGIIIITREDFFVETYFRNAKIYGILYKITCLKKAFFIRIVG